MGKLYYMLFDSLLLMLLFVSGKIMEFCNGRSRWGCIYDTGSLFYFYQLLS